MIHQIFLVFLNNNFFADCCSLLIKDIQENAQSVCRGENCRKRRRRRRKKRQSSSLNKCSKNICECATKTFPFNNKNFCALPNELGRGMDVHLLTPHEPNSQRRENSNARWEKVR